MKRLKSGGHAPRKGSFAAQNSERVLIPKNLILNTKKFVNGTKKIGCGEDRGSMTPSALRAVQNFGGAMTKLDISKEQYKEKGSTPSRSPLPAPS